MYWWRETHYEGSMQTSFQVYSGGHNVEINKGMRRTEIVRMFARIRTGFTRIGVRLNQTSCSTYQTHQYCVFSTIRWAHRLHQAVRLVASAEHIVHKLVSFLHAARFGLRVVRAEDPRLYATMLSGAIGTSASRLVTLHTFLRELGLWLTPEAC